MPRYVAFLRGVSPLNAKMPELKRCFEAAGFSDVRTLLSSGNVVFSARSAGTRVLERRAEKAMHDGIGKVFGTMVRPAEQLQALVDSNPFAEFKLPEGAKCVITFLRQPADSHARLSLPIERDDASILKVAGGEVFSAYVPNEKGPAFMGLIERTFGKDLTTRTLDTVRKCAWA
jgi:uncharacterized protein (DUF1697 family)